MSQNSSDIYYYVWISKIYNILDMIFFKLANHLNINKISITHEVTWFFIKPLFYNEYSTVSISILRNGRH